MDNFADTLFLSSFLLYIQMLFLIFSRNPYWRRWQCRAFRTQPPFPPPSSRVLLPVRVTPRLPTARTSVSVRWWSGCTPDLFAGVFSGCRPRWRCWPPADRSTRRLRSGSAVRHGRWQRHRLPLSPWPVRPWHNASSALPSISSCWSVRMNSNVLSVHCKSSFIWTMSAHPLEVKSEKDYTDIVRSTISWINSEFIWL